MKGVKNLILSIGVNKVLEEKYDKKKIQAIMGHAYKVALYSIMIAKHRKLRKFHDDIYVIALLHDFGKIIIETLQPEMVKRIQAICNKRGIVISVLEDLTDGYNHSIIGFQLAEKWNFPEQFVHGIKYHHIPMKAKDIHKGIVFSVYLANEMYHYIEGTRAFSEITYKVLKFFNLRKEKDFKEFADSITKKLSS